jgi:hypothetical protein
MEVKPGYKQTEVGVIPEDWDVKPLGALVSYTNGKAHEHSISDYGFFVVVNSKFISTEGLIRKYSYHCFCPASLGVPGMPCCEAVEIRCGPDRGNRDSKPTASS